MASQVSAVSLVWGWFSGPFSVGSSDHCRGWASAGPCPSVGLPLAGVLLVALGCPWGGAFGLGFPFLVGTLGDVVVWLSDLALGWGVAWHSDHTPHPVA